MQAQTAEQRGPARLMESLLNVSAAVPGFLQAGRWELKRIWRTALQIVSRNPRRRHVIKRPVDSRLDYLFGFQMP